jgi:hypothetical protein
VLATAASANFILAVLAENLDTDEAAA